MSVAQLVDHRELVVVCGPGGVGKTTMAAALGLRAAIRTDRRVLVLTVDPARRLAQALGLSVVGNTETVVAADVLADAGVHPAGELSVAMLDTVAGWDEVIASHAPDAVTRDRILANNLYRNVTGRFAQSHDYVAMERLHQLVDGGRYDLIVVDTPPTRNAIDFLEAPARMADFFSSRLLRWITAPYRSRAMGLASRPFFLVADRVLGADFLRDVAEFFMLFQSLYDGFVARSREVAAMLAAEGTTFAVVAAPDAAAIREAHFFLDELDSRSLEAGALVLNRMLPPSFRSTRAIGAARAMAADGDPAWAALGDRFLITHQRGEHQHRAVSELRSRVAETAIVPELTDALVDVAGVHRLGDHLAVTV